MGTTAPVGGSASSEPEKPGYENGDWDHGVADTIGTLAPKGPQTFGMLEITSQSCASTSPVSCTSASAFSAPPSISCPQQPLLESRSLARSVETEKAPSNTSQAILDLEELLHRIVGDKHVWQQTEQRSEIVTALSLITKAVTELACQNKDLAQENASLRIDIDALRVDVDFMFPLLTRQRGLVTSPKVASSTLCDSVSSPKAPTSAYSAFEEMCESVASASESKAESSIASPSRSVLEPEQRESSPFPKAESLRSRRRRAACGHKGKTSPSGREENLGEALARLRLAKAQALRTEPEDSALLGRSEVAAVDFVVQELVSANGQCSTAEQLSDTAVQPNDRDNAKCL